MKGIDPTPVPGGRRTIAVGILGRRAGRTITTIRTETGVTGNITSTPSNTGTCPGGLDFESCRCIGQPGPHCPSGNHRDDEHALAAPAPAVTA